MSAQRWYYRQLDFERRLMALCTVPGDDPQGEAGEVIAAFDMEYLPEPRHAHLMSMAPQLLEALTLAFSNLSDHTELDDLKVIRDVISQASTAFPNP